MGLYRALRQTLLMEKVNARHALASFAWKAQNSPFVLEAHMRADLDDSRPNLSRVVTALAVRARTLR